MKAVFALTMLAMTLGHNALAYSQSSDRQVVLNVSPVLSPETRMQAQPDGSVIVIEPRAEISGQEFRINDLSNSDLGICAAIKKRQIVSKHIGLMDDFEYMVRLGENGSVKEFRVARVYVKYIVCK